MAMCRRNMCAKAQRPLADLSECNNGCWKGRDSSVGLSDQSLDRLAVPTTTATPLPCSHTLLPSHLFVTIVPPVTIEEHLNDLKDDLEDLENHDKEPRVKALVSPFEVPYPRG
jgi:hypothetical protein